MDKKLQKLGKFLSLILRHQPEVVGLTLDKQGWVDVNDLIRAVQDSGRTFNTEMLTEIVRTNDKKRFSFSADGRKIRANQGHSVPVDLGLEILEPPEFLYHGTVAKYLNRIFSDGLIPGKRHHVHLSADVETAENVGQRRGKPIILIVKAGEMYGAGHKFYLSENMVWLTEKVSPCYLEFLNR
jgi:putative RNA 2'-phosphotransferase